MYRQKAAEIKQKARRAQNPSAKRAFEEVARAWLLLAEQIAWMDSQKRPLLKRKNNGVPHQTRACWKS
jgi:hypothetical protein